MTKALQLYNTFKRTLSPLELAGKVVSPTNGGQAPLFGSFYICGPTVYSDCHLGHALTYIRADLLRRVLKSYFNVKLLTVMNITDVDDKIIAKTNEEYPRTDAGVSSHTEDPASHPFNKVSDRYYRSFLEDMKSIRVQPPDLTMKISHYTHLITRFISQLEQNGQAYIGPNKDVYFRVSSVDNYIGRTDPRQQEVHDANKGDPRDFVLWKSAKPNEPVWNYHSKVSGLTIRGRPGWHVQCSAISSAIFGKKLSIHFGGKDLIFPHHYNEEACCCAFHGLDTSTSLHVWSNHWLHSGHLVLKDAKMSKSLGNVIAIKNFVGRTSVNALRLLCIQSHYRADIQYDEDLFEKCKSLDHKLNAFSSFLTESLRNCQDNLSDFFENPDNTLSEGVSKAIESTYNDIVDGICDDFDLERGLNSIFNLARLLYASGPASLRAVDLMVTQYLLREWCQTCGLEYGLVDSDADNQVLLDLLLNYRQNVRSWAINEIKSKKGGRGDKASLNKLLKDCDTVRSQLNELGFVARDGKVK